MPTAAITPRIRGPRHRRGRASQAALGYASVPAALSLQGPELEAQCERIAAACERLGLDLVAVVRDHEPAGGGRGEGLDSALERLRAGEATCLVVDELERLTRSVGALAGVVDRLERDGARLIALDVGLDTATPAGQAALERGEGTAPAAEPVPEPADATAAPGAEPAAAEPEPERAAAEPAPGPEPERAGTPAAPTATDPPPAAAAVVAMGYASVANGDESAGLDAQQAVIEREAERLGLGLAEIVHEREPKDGRTLGRAALSYLLEQLVAGRATCVIVTALDRLGHSVRELGTVLQWLERNRIRLIVIDPPIDTATAAGRTTAATLASVATWESARVSEATRKGLAAARAKRHSAADRPGADWAAVRKRIAALRADGMTLQAIADLLNEEGVPTPRGGARWRPSSVQTAAGYKRRPRATPADLPGSERSRRGTQPPG